MPENWIRKHAHIAYTGGKCTKPALYELGMKFALYEIGTKPALEENARSLHCKK
jgi:hypothetical protein